MKRFCTALRGVPFIAAGCSAAALSEAQEKRSARAAAKLPGRPSAAALALTVVALAMAPAAGAWTFTLSGSAECVTASGSAHFAVTWKLTNPRIAGVQEEAMTVRDVREELQDSDDGNWVRRTPVVSVGTVIASGATATYAETVPYSEAGREIELTISANWPTHSTYATKQA